jgi:Winged helix DNA-binding domain
MTREFTADRRQITALRLSAQHIDTADFERPADVVRHMLAMQAQDFAGAKWAVGLRTPGATDAEIELAIANREIVRSWPMRGTLHFVAPEDLGWMLSVTRDRTIRGAKTRLAERGLDESVLRRAEAVARSKLQGGGVLSRDDLQREWERAGIVTTGQRGYSILWYLSITGVLVFGPVLGKQHSFVLFDEWVQNSRQLSRDEALGEFARRYFESHGPATIRDFAWWSSLTLGDARRGALIVRDDLDELVVGDANYFLSKKARPAPRGVQMLPGFDEYILGYQDRRAGLSDGVAKLIIPGNNGVFQPTIVIDGEVVGTWRRAASAKQVNIELFPVIPLNKRSFSASANYAKRYGAFLQKPAIVSELPPTQLAPPF